MNDIEEREVGKEEKSKCELKLNEGIFVISPPICPICQLFTINPKSLYLPHFWPIFVNSPLSICYKIINHAPSWIRTKIVDVTLVGLKKSNKKAVDHLNNKMKEKKC